MTPSEQQDVWNEVFQAGFAQDMAWMKSIQRRNKCWMPYVEACKVYYQGYRHWVALPEDIRPESRHERLLRFQANDRPQPKLTVAWGLRP